MPFEITGGRGESAGAPGRAGTAAAFAGPDEIVEFTGFGAFGVVGPGG